MNRTHERRKNKVIKTIKKYYQGRYRYHHHINEVIRNINARPKFIISSPNFIYFGKHFSVYVYKHKWKNISITTSIIIIIIIIATITDMVSNRKIVYDHFGNLLWLLQSHTLMTSIYNHVVCVYKTCIEDKNKLLCAINEWSIDSMTSLLDTMTFIHSYTEDIRENLSGTHSKTYLIFPDELNHII